MRWPCEGTCGACVGTGEGADADAGAGAGAGDGADAGDGAPAEEFVYALYMNRTSSRNASMSDSPSVFSPLERNALIPTPSHEEGMSAEYPTIGPL